MARVKLTLPDNFRFSVSIPIRITDLNYGGHVGNDTILSLIHEARMQFLKHFGVDEMNFFDAGLIMSDAAVEFRAELFYGDVVTAFVTATDFNRVGFDLYYKLMRNETVVTLAKTAMICYSYEKKKIVTLPAAAKQRLGV